MVLTLLEDAQLEVRVQAAKVVSGLLHCHFIPEPTALLVCRVIYFVFLQGHWLQDNWLAIFVECSLV